MTAAAVALALVFGSRTLHAVSLRPARHHGCCAFPVYFDRILSVKSAKQQYSDGSGVVPVSAFHAMWRLPTWPGFADSDNPRRRISGLSGVVLVLLAGCLHTEGCGLVLVGCDSEPVAYPLMQCLGGGCLTVAGDCDDADTVDF